MTYVLALGFGTSALMWVLGYVSRIPPVWMPSSLLLILLLACLFLGGTLAGRYTGSGWNAGMRVGIVSSILNMLILGSLLGGSEANHIVPSAVWWIPGSVLAGAFLGAAGGVWGGTRRARAAHPDAVGAGPEAVDWTGVFAGVAAATTFCLIVVGGIVTSRRAGLSVVDWPNSYGYSMFLYPLSRMTGAVYYEHAHRLFGSLVGLTTLVLAIHLWRSEPRPWVRHFAGAALVLVVLQGLLGGLRVTGRFTMSSSPADTSPSTALAVIHGITGQLYFSCMLALAAFTSRPWKSNRIATPTPGASTDRGLTALMLVLLMIQLILGAILRHESRGLLVHITAAVIVLVLGVATGARAAALKRGQPILESVGRLFLWVLGLQMFLGVCALMARILAGGAAEPPVYKVVITTAHQANGAVLLGSAVLLALWTRRLLQDEPVREPAGTERLPVSPVH
jgi:heme a synthase